MHEKGKSLVPQAKMPLAVIYRYASK